MRKWTTLLAVAGLTGGVLASAATLAGPAAADHGPFLFPGNLLVSRSVYMGAPITAGQTMLPPGCTTGCVVASSDGSYPGVWNNDQVDGSFGVTSPVYLDEITPSGRFLGSVAVPSGPRHDHLVTSFSSKSELALNLSTDGRYITFMGYVAPVSALDVSNSNTPGVIDPTNPVPGATFRAVARMDAWGRFQFTETNAYSGNNGRAAILNDRAGVFYTAGNAGNGGNPQPVGVITGTGAQLVTPTRRPERFQQPAATTPVGSFNITELGDPADKIGKDTNFRGLTVFDNVVYLTKGSGGNGVNTVYFIDTTGHACPNGVGVPQPGAALPTSPIAFDPGVVQAQGLPNNMCVLDGFPTALKTKTSFPFGVWFANPDTAYVADEGNGTNTFSATTGTYTAAAAQTTAGLQKWVRANGIWQLAYTLTGGLDLGVPYQVPGYPQGVNAVTGLPWAPATDGLRNLTGR
ncbi:MAG TPA: hypothetical protein VH352_20220, partial [Pseudonocardiaceae bacterium]|nr:hypothetical protein [Pseudonocardiaceae bacterium]